MGERLFSLVILISSQLKASAKICSTDGLSMDEQIYFFEKKKAMLFFEEKKTRQMAEERKREIGEP